MSITLIVAIMLGVMFGGLLQGSIGVGFALIMLPMLVVLAPELLPGTVLPLMLPLNALRRLARMSLWRPQWHGMDHGRPLWSAKYIYRDHG